MNLEKVFEDIIIKKGHFVLRSGKHSDKYIEKIKIAMFSELYNAVIRQ